MGVCYKKWRVAAGVYGQGRSVARGLRRGAHTNEEHENITTFESTFEPRKSHGRLTQFTIRETGPTVLLLLYT